MMPLFRRNHNTTKAARQTRGMYISVSLMAVTTSVSWLSNDATEVYHDSALMMDMFANITTSIVL